MQTLGGIRIVTTAVNVPGPVAVAMCDLRQRYLSETCSVVAAAGWLRVSCQGLEAGRAGGADPMQLGVEHGHETKASGAKNPPALPGFSRDHAIGLGQLLGRIPWMQVFPLRHRGVEPQR